MKTSLTLTLIILVAVSVLVSACTAPAPTITPSTTKTSERPKPVGGADNVLPAVTKSAEASVGKSPANADWQAEWGKTVDAAKKEGKVVVAGPAGELPRQAAMAFRKAYPDIQLEFSGVKGSDFAPKILAERDAGQYLWDIHWGGATTAVSTLVPKGVLDPVKSVLFLPEVVDDGKWLGGLDDLWMDQGKQYVFPFEAGLQATFLVNRDAAPDRELSSIGQLLDPKWKGKIVAGDLRSIGTPLGKLTVVALANGDDWLRKFLAQDIVTISDERAVLESVVRGRYPIMLNVSPATEALLQSDEFKSLAVNVQPLDPDGPGGASLNSGNGNLMLVNKRPHPDAAKVFINWLLSKDGQKAYVDATGLVSARLDVESQRPAIFNPSLKYINDSKEDMIPDKQRVLGIVKEMLK